MYPVFRDLDLLYILHKDTHKLRPGDIIAFLPPGGVDIIVHRIVKIHAGCFLTKGDNRKYIDSYKIASANILGIVDKFHRNDRIHTVNNGFLGIITIFRRRLGLFLNPILNTVLVAFLKLSCRWDLVRKILQAIYKYKIVTSETGAPPKIFLYIGSNKIGEFLWCENRWQIISPYDLFLDRLLLPSTQDLIKKLPVNHLFR